ncbi:MAG TPA: arginyltransferase [Candidatus Cybelea sp.]|nr:arginyltransferase [Candidatus Cybelea sp.]
MSVQGRGFPIPFLVTTEVPCPYLPGRMERKIITELSGAQSPELFEVLSHAGFRRSHSIAYRPACAGCQACVPVRIVAEDFAPGRSLKRVLKRNANLRASVTDAVPTQEQFKLFARYLEARHNDGEMVGMGPQDYASMVGDSPVDTRIVELREGRGRLVAACLTDWGQDGISAVYSFFDPDLARNSLGSYIVLWLIQEARRRDLGYVYLGYWVAGSQKMDYKRRFNPIEAYGPAGWVRIQPAEDLN